MLVNQSINDQKCAFNDQNSNEISNIQTILACKSIDFWKEVNPKWEKKHE